jgi:AcrR family transcriptional regulator
MLWISGILSMPSWAAGLCHMAKSGKAGARPYHHGNLRRVVLDAALVEIAERGPMQLSLRELARRAGVSHAAPAYHFGDKTGLPTAVAAEGFERLGDALSEGRDAGGFLEIGLAYIRFAVSNPAHFEVMFRPELYRADDPSRLVLRPWLRRPLDERQPSAPARR